MSVAGCAPSGDCQQGGIPAIAALGMANSGVTTLDCWPYDCDTCGQKGDEKCSGKQCEKYYVKQDTIFAGIVKKPGVDIPSSINDIDIPATIQLIKHSIYTSGPVVTGFSVPSDIMDIPNGFTGIYKSRNPNNSVGGHAVCIVGWGNDPAGKLYWIIRNSWGTGWADGGYFKAYGYPDNNVGFDIPLIESSTQVQAAKHAIKLSTNIFDDNYTSKVFGGVTLWEIDLARSPSNPPKELSVVYSTMSKSTRNTLIIVSVSIVVIIVGLLVAKYIRERRGM
jgi:hypothetical protein